LSHSALNVECGNIQILEHSLSEMIARSERATKNNPNASAWNLPAFAARAAILHLNPQAGPAEINGKVFRYVHDLGLRYKKESFAKAVGRNQAKVQMVERAVAAIAKGEAVDDLELQTACAAALKYFQPK
jgi:hypothetical protein